MHASIKVNSCEQKGSHVSGYLSFIYRQSLICMDVKLALLGCCSIDVTTVICLENILIDVMNETDCVGFEFMAT